MKTIILACIVYLVSVNARPAVQYTNKYDGLEITEVLSNPRLLMPYIKCILDQGKCSPEGKELKSHIQEALENFCEKCTEAQRNGTRAVISHLINNEPVFWKDLVSKYDPQRKYIKKYEDELKSIKA